MNMKQVWHLTFTSDLPLDVRYLLYHYSRNIGDRPRCFQVKLEWILHPEGYDWGMWTRIERDFLNTELLDFLGEKRPVPKNPNWTLLDAQQRLAVYVTNFGLSSKESFLVTVS